MIVREFVVAEGKEQEFLQVFGPDGSWPALLMTVDGSNLIFETNENDNTKEAIYLLNKASCP